MAQCAGSARLRPRVQRTMIGEAQAPSAAMTQGGVRLGLGSLPSIRCARGAKLRAWSSQPTWSTTSFRIVATPYYSGIESIIGVPYVIVATRLKRRGKMVDSEMLGGSQHGSSSNTCIQCSTLFFFPRSRGKWSKYCSQECRKASKREALERLQPRLGVCSKPGCDTPVRSAHAKLCDTHYCRLRRTGTLDDRQRAKQYLTKSGYRRLWDPTHPICDAQGMIAEHRKVVYEAVATDTPICFWCNKLLTWKTTVIDHLNEDKTDNRVENLVTSCNPCNRARGAMLPFIRSLSDEAFTTFICQASAYRASLKIEPE